jgi:serine/threonine protein kinase/tetratricopeptide (TPR) repeat protein
MHRDECFPTLIDAPMLSSVRKEQVRAALFHKMQPVRVDRFVLLERLGAGSMGEIYAAYDDKLDRRVALKLVRQGTKHTLNADGLIQREAKALAQVSHPNVVQVYDAGEHAGRLFIAMELIRGKTLTSWLEEAARLPRRQRQREILRRFIDAGRGLEAAHAAGVAHRDFKPDNVLVSEDGRVRVVDFGLARALVDRSYRSFGTATGANTGRPDNADAVASGHAPVSPTESLGSSAPVSAWRATAATLDLEPASSPAAVLTSCPDVASLEAAPMAMHAPAFGMPKLTAATRLTEPGMWMGTPQFMAPEQLRREVADHRSDQFSFCVALYHALYGVFPFPVNGADKLLAGKNVENLLESMRNGASGLEHSVGVAACVRKALGRGLSFEPSRRFAHMGELLATLEPCIRRRSRRFAGAVLLFIVGVMAGARCMLPVPPVPCASAGDGIVAAWSGDQQMAVHAAFLRSKVPFADVEWRSATQRLDHYADRWQDEAVAACRATRVDDTQSEQQFDRRMSCLERGRRHFEALVSELTHATPEAVEHAVEATESLPDFQACSHSENLLFGLEPPSAAIADQVTAVRKELARALVAENLGRTEDSLVIARQADAATQHLKYPPLRAEVLAQIARALHGRSTKDARDEAQRLYFEALDIAEAERHDALAAAIWGRLVRLTIQMDAGTEQAHAWWRRYEAAVRRIGDSPYDRAKLHNLLGQIYLHESKYADAADEANHAITAISSAPEQRVELSRYYGDLANALLCQGRVDDAIGMYETALKLATDALGQAHPLAIRVQMNYGNALGRAGQRTRAVSVLEAALANLAATHRDSHLDAGKLHAFLSDLSLLEGRLDDAAAHGHDSLQIYLRAGAPDSLRAEAYDNLGAVEQARSNFKDALALYEKALMLRQRNLSSDHYQIALEEGYIAESLLRLSRYGEAMAHVREAERIFGRAQAPDRADQGWLQAVRGEVLLGQRQLDAAVDVLQRALLLIDHASAPRHAANATWALTRALYGLGKDPGRVRELAERARALFATLGTREARNHEAVIQFIQRVSHASASHLIESGGQADRNHDNQGSRDVKE